MMSPALLDRIGDDSFVEESHKDDIGDVQIISVIIHLLNEDQTRIIASLRSALFENDAPELEIRLLIDHAFDIIEWGGPFAPVYYYGDREIDMKKIFTIHATKMLEIDPINGMCTLAIAMKERSLEQPISNLRD